MSDETHNDPTPVMKFVAGCLLFLTIAILIGLMIWKGRAIDKWTVLALAVPCLGLLVMLFDGVRNAVLSIASALPSRLVKYEKPEQAE